MAIKVNPPSHGFTLIELSIVLVIIGLIVGGVLVGRDLITNATVRAQISQIEKFNQAVNAFKGKYGALPGDIAASDVVKFGFTAVPVRTGDAGRGNNDGMINAYGTYVSAPVNYGVTGEAIWFWEDLSTNARLIEGGFNSSLYNQPGGAGPGLSTDQYLPPAKIGGENYVMTFNINGINYFEIIIARALNGSSGFNGYVGLTVAQAYSIDNKIDDGIPVSGNVQTSVVSSNFYSPNGNTYDMGGGFLTPVIASASPSATTCYDTTSNRYSITQNNGQGVNCALSFKFQ